MAKRKIATPIPWSENEKSRLYGYCANRHKISPKRWEEIADELDRSVRSCKLMFAIMLKQLRRTR